MKLRWEMSSEPTGRYRSFQRRGWPTAFFQDGRYAGHILCDDDYVPRLIRECKHLPLQLVAQNYVTGKRYRLREQFATLPQAKIGLLTFLQKHPDFVPRLAEGEEAKP